MADLPSEVITEILSRLPVKSLLQLRCTCKCWRSTIDSTDFIFFHLNKSSESNLILRHHSRLYQLQFDTVEKVEELHHPLMCYSNRIKILGSCNGLICFCNIADDIAFWNPSIRKHRILPTEPFNRKLNKQDSSNTTTLLAARVYGFGYDSFSDDYKLVSLSYFVDLHNRRFDSQVRLYTMRTDAWKTLPSMPYALCCARTMGVYVGGALHWVVTRKLEPDQPDLIVAFDLRFEIFREVSLPVTVSGRFDMEVAILGECLCVIENRGSEGYLDVWVMRKYGSQDSWYKLLSFEQPHPHGERSIKSLKPLVYSRDGDKVLLEHDRSKLCWYKLGSSNEVSSVRISGMPKSFEGTVCVGSFVPPTLLSRSRRRLLKKHNFGDEKKRDDFLSKGFKLTL